jgi:transposase
VRRWRAKYLAGGVAAVGTIAPGRGRKRRVDADVVEAIVADTLNTVPEDGSTQWSTPRRRHQDFLFFLKLIDLHVPKDLDVHLVLDNLNTHSHEKVAKWLAHPKRRRFHLHFTPTSSSWLNLVERWFKEITDKRIRRGSFRSVDELIEAVDHWSEHWNDDPKPFVWHRTAEEIIAKVRRGRAALDPGHQIRDAPPGVAGR